MRDPPRDSCDSSNRETISCFFYFLLLTLTVDCGIVLPELLVTVLGSDFTKGVGDG